MRRRAEKVSRWELIVLAGLSVGMFAVLVNSARTAKAPDFAARSEAAKLCEQAFAAIRCHREAAIGAIDEINDPNRTGLVGSQYSLVTVGRGDLNGVMTATNPNFVAVILSLLRKARLGTGDAVAIGLNGSSPALNIEVLAACKVLGVRPIVIAAAGSGMWGANDPRFTWLDMEALLNRAGILPFRSAAASLGGEGDNGRGLSPAGRDWLDSTIVRNGVPAILPQSLEDAVSQRMTIYRREAGMSPIRAFINVGNAVANLGETEKPLPTGVVERRPGELPNPSVVRAMAEGGATIINLYDVNRLAYRYKFPVAPIPMPPLAKGRMFVEKRYPVNLAVLFAVVIIALLFIVIEIDLDYYVKRLLHRSPEATGPVARR
jgi:poly-gamma-glutamate system protein